MGVVYRAWHGRLQRAVAIKVIAPELAAERNFRARFERESLLAAQIEHPNVIPVYEVGEWEGLLFIVMRYVEGVDAGELLSRSGRVEPRRAASIVNQSAAALDAAHARGLVHRDVKPGNLLVSGGGGAEHVYLTDFGITKRIADTGGLTAPGQFVGTVDYVAPEQILGHPIDARSDVYALGCVLYQLLTGVVPFPRDADIPKLFAHVNDPPPSPRAIASAVPRELDSVVTKAMAKSPDDRYLSAGDLGRAAIAGAERRAHAGLPRSVAIGAAAPQTTRHEPATAAPETSVAEPDKLDPVATERMTSGSEHRVLAVEPEASAITGPKPARPAELPQSGTTGPAATRHPPASAPRAAAITESDQPGTVASEPPSRQPSRHDDEPLSARLAVERLADDDSRKVAARARVVLSPAVAVTGAVMVIASVLLHNPLPADRAHVWYRIPVAVMCIAVILLIWAAYRLNRRPLILAATGLALILLGVTFPMSWPPGPLPGTLGFWLGACGSAVVAGGAAWLAYKECPPGVWDPRGPTISRVTRFVLVIAGPVIVVGSLFVLPEWSDSQATTWDNWAHHFRYPASLILLCGVVIGLSSRGVLTDRRRWLVMATGIACLVLGESVPLIFVGDPHWGAGRWLRIFGAVAGVAGLTVAAATTRDAVSRGSRSSI
jgi:hypothetical protein